VKSGGRSAVLISGGLGVAPMPVAARDARAAGLLVTWVHGARSADDLCSESEGDAVIVATDDGSAGFAGTSVAAAPDADLVLACGPNRMLAAVAGRWPDAQVAVETYMACGTGVCLGCAVPLKRGGYDRACTAPPRIAETPSGMLNAIGLQGPGAEALIRDYAPQWAGWEFPVLVNINGESVSDYGELTARLDGVPGVAGFEVNISCPNVE